ncbi:MAG TPA: HTTM domain-containing protein [Bacteroidia bacterium]|nr:HTTM domain-containing protein [Bacteroidia bacterium]
MWHWNKINSLVDNFTNSFKYVNTIKLFRGSLLVFIFLYVIQFLPIAQQYFGPNNFMVPYYKSSNILLKPLNLLEGEQFSKYYLFFLYGLLFSIIAYFLLPLKRLSLVICYVLLMNIYHKTAPLQNGGFSLLTMVLFMLIFIDEEAKFTTNKYWKAIKITLANFGFLAMQLQVVFLYLVASYYKLQGQTWVDGTAFYYVLYNDLYTHPVFTKYFIDNTFVIRSVSWFTLLFQMFFPILVWIKRTKNIMLFAGIFLHIMIAWVMGIVDFGIIMILMYTLFNSENFNSKLLDFLSFKRKVL